MALDTYFFFVVDPGSGPRGPLPGFTFSNFECVHRKDKNRSAFTHFKKRVKALIILH